MTPEEKAKELFNKMDKFQEYYLQDGKEWSKQCALICVDEIIKSLKEVDILDYSAHNTAEQLELDIYYWCEVKKEIELL